MLIDDGVREHIAAVRSCGTFSRLMQLFQHCGIIFKRMRFTLASASSKQLALRMAIAEIL